jgi:hypothetical protein
MNEVPIRDGNEALRVNRCELEITDESGKVRKRFAFVADHLITRYNVVELVNAGRARALTRYLCFDGWEEMMLFMLRGLEIPYPGG